VDAQHDAQAAVRWFRRFAGKLGVNPNRIYVAGQSAASASDQFCSTTRLASRRRWFGVSAALRWSCIR